MKNTSSPITLFNIILDNTVSQKFSYESNNYLNKTSKIKNSSVNGNNSNTYKSKKYEDNFWNIVSYLNFNELILFKLTCKTLSIKVESVFLKHIKTFALYDNNYMNIIISHYWTNILGYNE